MYILGANLVQVERAVRDADPTHNLCLAGSLETTWGIHVKLRVKDSKGNFAKRGVSGRRTVSTCFHGFGSFMAEMFSIDPTLKIRSSMTTFNGLVDFLENAYKIGRRNAGSMYEPRRYGEMCECSYTPDYLEHSFMQKKWELYDLITNGD